MKSPSFLLPHFLILLSFTSTALCATSAPAPVSAVPNQSECVNEQILRPIIEATDSLFVCQYASSSEGGNPDQTIADLLGDLMPVG